MHETQRRRRGHVFLPPKAVLRRIPKLYATDGTPAEDKMIRLHYFCASGDWWIAELNPETNEAFGYARLAAYPDDAEWGYFDLEELERLNAPGRINGQLVPGLVIVERDCHWQARKFCDL